MTQPASDARGADVRLPPPLIFLIYVLVGIAVHYALMPLPVPVARIFSAAGGVFILLLGVAVVVLARIHFSRTGQSPIPWKPSPELILQGPYRYTRNPMYVGVTIIQIGLGAALNNLWISLFAPLALLTVHFVAVLPEERYLSEKFGESYKTYLTRVRRYL